MPKLEQFRLVWDSELNKEEEKPQTIDEMKRALFAIAGVTKT